MDIILKSLIKSSNISAKYQQILNQNAIKSEVIYKDPNNEGKNEINPSKNNSIFVICEKSFEFKIKNPIQIGDIVLVLTRRGKKHVSSQRCISRRHRRYREEI